jgi:type III restriction enzyme
MAIHPKFPTSPTRPRLKQWCADATLAATVEGGPAYRFVYVDQAGFEQHPSRDFAGLEASFTEFQEDGPPR